MSQIVRARSERQLRSLRPVAMAAGVIALGLIPTAGQAAWVGVGAGGAGTDFNNTANWSNSTVDGDFTGNTTTPASPVTLSAASTSLTGLKFNWATNAINLNINGDGSGTRTIVLAGDILLPSVTTTSSTITLGSDVTLDYGSFAVNRSIQFGPHTTATTNALAINGLVTGSTTNNSAIGVNFVTKGNPILYLNNTGNTFDAAINSNGGAIFYNSIGNVNGGASSLGSPSTVAHGTIVDSVALVYSGTTNTTSDRVLTLAGNGNLVNNSATGTTQTFTTNLATSGGGSIFNGITAINSGSVLDIQGVIPNNTGTRNIRVNWRSQVAGTSSDVTGAGTVKFGGNNTYLGQTQVIGGKLLINGDQSLATGLVTVNSGATLGGNGKVGGAITINGGGHLAPGNSVGTLTDTNIGALTLGGTAIYDYEVGGTTASPTNDLIDLTGAGSTVSFGGAWSLKVSNLGTVDPTGKTFVLFDYTGTDPANVGTPAISFGAGATNWTGGSVGIDSANSRIVLSGITLVPEPTCLGLLGLSTVAMLRRRQRRA